MTVTSVVIAGGGQSLALATTVLATVSFREGYDVRSSDAVELAQRAGMVWSNVRFGEAAHDLPTPVEQADYLVVMGALKGLSWVHRLKPGATVILSKESVLSDTHHPERYTQPEDLALQLAGLGYSVKTIEAKKLAEDVRCPGLVNLVLLGHLSRHLPFSVVAWVEVIKRSVPLNNAECYVEAFLKGREQATAYALGVRHAKHSANAWYSTQSALCK